MDKFVEGGQILYDLGCRSHAVGIYRGWPSVV
jgi:hypothetical protein